MDDFFLFDEPDVDPVVLIEEMSSPVGPGVVIRTVRITAPPRVIGVSAVKSPTVVTAKYQHSCQ